MVVIHLICNIVSILLALGMKNVSLFKIVSHIVCPLNTGWPSSLQIESVCV